MSVNMTAPQWRNLKLTVGLLILLYLFPYTVSDKDNDKCQGCQNGGTCYTYLQTTAPLASDECNTGWFRRSQKCYKVLWEFTNTTMAKASCNGSLAEYNKDLCPKLQQFMKSLYISVDRWPEVYMNQQNNIVAVNTKYNCEITQITQRALPLCYDQSPVSTPISLGQQCRCANATAKGSQCLTVGTNNGSYPEENYTGQALQCPKSFYLQIHFAAFGVDTGRETKMTCYAPNSLSLLRFWCQGRQYCRLDRQLTAEADLYVSSECKGTPTFYLRKSCFDESIYTCPSGTYPVKALQDITCLKFVGERTWVEALETCRNLGGGLPIFSNDLNYTVWQGLIANTSELRVMKLKMWVGGNSSNNSSVQGEIKPNTYLSIDIENKSIHVLEHDQRDVTEDLPFVCNFDKVNNACPNDTFDLTSVGNNMGTDTAKPCYKYESSKFSWLQANETCHRQNGMLAFYPHTTFPSYQIFNLLDPFLQSLRADQIDVWVAGKGNESRDYSHEVSPCSSVIIDNENLKVQFNLGNQEACLQTQNKRNVFCALPPNASERESSKLSPSDVLLGDSPSEPVLATTPKARTGKKKFGISSTDDETKTAPPPATPTVNSKPVPDQTTTSTTVTPVISLVTKKNKKVTTLGATTDPPTPAFTLPSATTDPSKITLPPQNPLTNSTPINETSKTGSPKDESTASTAEETAQTTSETTTLTDHTSGFQSTVHSATDTTDLVSETKDSGTPTIPSLSSILNYTRITDISSTDLESTLESSSTTPPTTRLTQAPLKNCSNTISSRGNLTWNETTPGKTQTQPCPGKAKGFVRWTCGWNGEFEGKPNFINCSNLLPAETWLANLKKNTSTQSVVEQFTETINNTTLYGADLKHVTDFTDRVVEHQEEYIESISDPKQRQSVAENFIKALAIIVERTLTTESDTADAWHDLKQEDRGKTGSKLLQSQEKAGFLLANNMNNDSLDIKKNSFEMTVMSHHERFYENNDWKYPDKLLENGTVSAELPKGLAKNVSDKGFVRSVFIVYKNLTAVLPATSNAIHKDSAGNGTDFQLVTGVLGINLNSSSTSLKLTNGKVKMEFIHMDKSVVGTTYCVFWNMKDLSNPRWDPSGCTVKENNTYHTICLCDHLTNFAVLMDVHNTLKDSEADTTALKHITIVGCTISVVCLLMTFIIFTIFRSLWNLRTTIHRNLSLSLFIVQLVLLVGLDKTDNRVGCGIVAGILHYFLLSSFFWMALEGVHIYVLLIKVFETGEPKSWRYYIAGYGIPALIVAISASIRPDSYGTSRYCWLSNEHGFIFAFAGPMAAILCFNIVILILALRAAASVKAPRQQSKVESARLWIKRSASLLPLLGVTWVFGFLFVNKSLLVFAYLFAIFNSLQGLFIFVFHCVRNEKVQQVLSRYIAKKREKFESSTSGKQSRTNSCTVTSSLRVNNSEFTNGSRKSSKSSRNGSISPLKIGI